MQCEETISALQYPIESISKLLFNEKQYEEANEETWRRDNGQIYCILTKMTSSETKVMKMQAEKICVSIQCV